VRELAARGLPLGLRAAAASAPATTVPLPAMGLLVLYTDGLVEATRDLEEGERRLREASVRVALEGAEHPAEAIQTSVLRNGAQDDVAVLTVAFTAQSASRRVA
jgi:serine phosphatase RsbU (regulator of sigma subunit)